MAMIMRSGLPRAFTMMSRREAHGPRRPHWHIGPVGVHPDEQGHGVGQLLRKRFLATVDVQRAPAFLKTVVDRKVRLYQRFGFEVKETEDIVGVDTRFLWREARILGETST
jgi:predicted N-acetyltransferase YhbS